MRSKESFIIQQDYRSHKKRLQRIKKSDPSQKINRITSQYFQLTYGHKKIRQIDHSFQQREESSRRQRTRSLMNKTISQYSKRIKQKYEATNTLLPLTHRTSRFSLRGDFGEHIQSQNARAKAKIDGMRSAYHKIRRNSDFNCSSLMAEQKNKKKQNRYQIIRLLNNQINIAKQQPQEKNSVQEESGDKQIKVQNFQQLLQIKKQK